ncbi:MAG TPA: ABC transporter ATP-binding protein [Vicinamibacterales bacterium]|nr:ABC transporter ATP-binding protein [Vicinamibacterales bacterium]
MPDQPAIAVRDLAKSYGSVHAVRGVSFDVHGGEILGFLGLNGAGKTTTIRILLDLLRPTRGTARIFGIDCQRDGRAARAKVGYTPGELGLYSDMTGRQLLDLMAALCGARVDDGYRLKLVDRLELARADLDRTLREYSTGMKRKVGLVQALQGDPPLLILDEPTEGLDPLVQLALNELLFDLRSRGRTVFMSSHVLSEVQRLCNRIAVIRAGEIVLLSTVDDARRLGGRVVRVRFSEPPAGAHALALPAGMTVVERTGEGWTISAEGEIGALLQTLARLPVRDVEIVEPSLEDVLQRFYREDRREPQAGAGAK